MRQLQQDVCGYRAAVERAAQTIIDGERVLVQREDVRDWLAAKTVGACAVPSAPTSGAPIRATLSGDYLFEASETVRAI